MKKDVEIGAILPPFLSQFAPFLSQVAPFLSQVAPVSDPSLSHFDTFWLIVWLIAFDSNWLDNNNDDFRLKNDDFLLKNDNLLLKNDDFVLKNDNFLLISD